MKAMKAMHSTRMNVDGFMAQLARHFRAGQHQNRSPLITEAATFVSCSICCLRVLPLILLLSSITVELEFRRSK